MQVLQRLEDVDQRTAAKTGRQRFGGLHDPVDRELVSQRTVAGQLGVHKRSVEVEKHGVAGEGARVHGHVQICT